jgi:hypothetical protein
MGFLKDAAPGTGIMDIYHYIRQDRPYRKTILLVSCLPPVILYFAFYFDYMERTKPPPPTVTYFESWPADRSLDDSIAAITKRQAEKEVFLERKLQTYRTLARASGMDVDKIEQEASKIREDKRKADAAAFQKAVEEAKQLEKQKTTAELAPNTIRPDAPGSR